MPRGGVIFKLAKERLIVVGDHNIQITHEALIREWDLLRAWVNEARDDLALRDRLEPDATRWARLAATDPAKAETLLLHAGLRLEEGRRLIEKSATLLEGFPVIQSYVARSIEAGVEHMRRDRESQAAILARTRRHNRRLTIAASVAAVLFLLATALAIGFGNEWQTAVIEKAESDQHNRLSRMGGSMAARATSPPTTHVFTAA